MIAGNVAIVLLFRHTMVLHIIMATAYLCSVCAAPGTERCGRIHCKTPLQSYWCKLKLLTNIIRQVLQSNIFNSDNRLIITLNMVTDMWVRACLPSLGLILCTCNCVFKLHCTPESTKASCILIQCTTDQQANFHSKLPMVRGFIYLMRDVIK